MEESPVSSIEAMSPEHLKTIKPVAAPQQSIERYWRVLRKSEDSLTSSMECMSSMQMHGMNVSRDSVRSDLKNSDLQHIGVPR
jgi:hypothetical protein